MRSLWLAALLVIGCDDPDPCRSAAGEVCALAGTGRMGFNRDGLRPEATDLYLVSAVRRGPDGLVYLMDFNNQRLRVIDGGVVRTVAGTGWHSLPAEGGRAVDEPLEKPVDFDFLPDGRLVFVSCHDPRVLRIERDGTLRAVAGRGDPGLLGNEGDGGPALAAQFIQLA